MMPSQTTSRAALQTVLLVTLAAFAVGCTKSAPAPQPSSGTKTAAPSQALGYGGQAVTEGEFYDAAVALEAAAAESAEAVGAFFDMYAICETAAQDLSQNKAFAASMSRAFEQLADKNLIGAQIYRDIPQGGTYRLVHVFRRGADHSAVFRLINTQGINYHVLKLTKKPQGKIVVDDAYILLTGEMLTTTMRRMFLPVAAHENRTALEKMLKSENEYIAHFDKLQQMNGAFQAGDAQAALTAYGSLPAGLQSLKPVLIVRLTSAARLMDYEEYERAVADYGRLYPGDRAIDLLSLDLLIKEKKLDEALAAVDRIDEFVGVDHHLNMFRGVIQLEAGKPAEAERLFAQAITHPDALADSYWQLITLSLNTKQHEKTRKYLTEVESRYQLQIEDLRTLPEYAEFVASPQYEQWLKRGEK